MIAKTTTTPSFRMRYHTIITKKPSTFLDWFPDDTTEQRLEFSNDAGKTWTPVLVEEITTRTEL